MRNQDHEHHEVLSSTNDRARVLAETGAGSGFLVTASKQTQGRGQRGRSWVSEPGSGLYMSVVLRPQLETARAGLIALMAGVATAHALDDVRGSVRLKWPNDLWSVRAEKLGGILIESTIRDGALLHAIIGIGLNLTPDAARSRRLDIPSCALTDLGGESRPAAQRAQEIRASILGWTDRLEDGPTAVVEAYRDLTFGVGLDCSLETDDGIHRGRFSGIDEGGALRLVTDGEVMAFHTGRLRFPHAGP